MKLHEASLTLCRFAPFSIVYCYAGVSVAACGVRGHLHTSNACVQVREWGSGEPAQLDDLQVSSFAGNFVADDGPFYVSLARQLELLEVGTAASAVSISCLLHVYLCFDCKPFSVEKGPLFTFQHASGGGCSVHLADKPCRQRTTLSANICTLHARVQVLSS